MSVDFAIKDLVRNRQVSKPFIVAIAASVSIVVFGIGFSGLFNAVINGTETPLFSSGFTIIFQQFNLMLLILLTVLPISALIFSLYAWIGHKKRDIATMKAIGTFPAKLYSFFVIELLLITVIGYVIGFVCGSGAYLLAYLILEGVGISIPFQVDLIWNLIVFGSLTATAYFVGGVHLRKIAGTLTVTEILAGDIPRTTFAGSHASVFLRGLSRLGTSLKVAIRNISRRLYDFRCTFAILATCGTIIFISVLGTISLETSVQGYASGTINENTIAVGPSDLLPYLNRLYAQFSDPTKAVGADELNFSQSQFFFPERDISAFSSISGVIRVDPRVCLMEHFFERKGYGIKEGVRYSVGQNREGVATIMGVNSSLMQESFYEGSFVSPTDSVNVTIGDGIAFEYFDDYDAQVIEFHSEEFRMVGEVVDTLYNGRSIYMGIQGLWNHWPELTGQFNILLVQVDPNNYESVKNALASAAQTELGSEFSVIDLRPTLQNNLGALNSALLYFIILAVATVAIASIALVEYQKGASTLKEKDLRIMRAMGAKRSFLTKTLYWENFLLTIPSFGLAIGIGMLFVQFTLVANIELLPPLWVPLLIGISLVGIFALANLVISVSLFQRSRGLPDDLGH